jgi:drug/metabolite transporter (DMT)-like permease
MSTPGVRPYLWMVCGTFNFATMSALSRSLALQNSDWRLLALARAGLMLAFAVPIALATRSRLTLRGSPTLWLRSIVGSLGLLCTFYTLSHLHISESITLLNMYPIWVSLLSWIVFKEVPALKVWLAVGAGLTGVILIAQPHFGQERFALGVGVVSSVFTAIVMLGLNRLKDLEANTIVVHFAAVSTAITTALFLFSGKAVSLGMQSDATGVVKLLGVGLTGTIGQIALTRAFALGEPSRVSIVGLTQLLFGVMYDVLIWHRGYTPGTIAGIVLVTAPTAWLLAGRAGRGLTAPREPAGPPGSDARATTT